MVENESPVINRTSLEQDAPKFQVGTIDERSKSAEIEAQFKKQVESGKPFVYYMKPSSNPKFITMFIAQKAEGGSQPGGVERLLLGWDSTTIIRTIHQVATEIQEKMKIFAGHVFDSFNILIEEDFVSRYAGQTPKVNPANGDILYKDGKPIYRHTKLVDGTPNHKFIEHDNRQFTGAPGSMQNNQKSIVDNSGGAEFLNDEDALERNQSNISGRNFDKVDREEGRDRRPTNDERIK